MHAFRSTVPSSGIGLDPEDSLINTGPNVPHRFRSIHEVRGIFSVLLFVSSLNLYHPLGRLASHTVGSCGLCTVP